MIQGTAVLRGIPMWAREAARRVVSGICVADESRVFEVPGASFPARALPAVWKCSVITFWAKTSRMRDSRLCGWHAPAILAPRL